MKTSPLLLSLLLLSILVHGQTVNEQLESFRVQIEQLELKGDSLSKAYVEMARGNKDLEAKLSLMYLEELRDMENCISGAFDKTDVISVSAAYQDVIKSIISLHNEITRINNFSDAEKVFGIDFSDQLTDIMEKSLTSSWLADSLLQKDEKLKMHRTGIRMLIRGFIQNPVISGLLRTNPVTSVAHSVINQVLLYQQHNLHGSRIERGGYKLPDNYRDFKNEYPVFRSSYHNTKIVGEWPGNNSGTMNSVDKMTKELSPFIQLFDDLARINDKYASSLHVFMKASEQTSLRVKPLEKAFYNKLQASNREEARQKITAFFNVGTEPSLEILEKKLNDSQMKKVLLFSEEIDEGLRLLKNDFLKIITLEMELSSEYIAFFSDLVDEKRSSMPSLVNSQEIEKKIAQFEQLKNSLASQKKKLEEIK